jgi:hypothetical protein
MSLKEFTINAKSLSKNPLGIIALFVSLIYGFACLVLGFTSNNLVHANEKLPLIWFIIIFPFVILFAFVYLVINHHEKLYAPGDFRGDEAFIRALDGKKISEKREKETEKLNKAEDLPEKENEAVATSEPISTIVDSEDFKLKIKNAEKWVAKDIELDYLVPTRLNQKLVSRSGSEIIDILGSSGDGYIVCEVKYWKHNKSYQQLKNEILNFAHKRERFSRIHGFQKGFQLVFAIVFDILEKVETQQLDDFVNENDLKVDLRLYDYKTLQNQYE